jgi:hypothetical protein
MRRSARNDEDLPAQPLLKFCRYYDALREKESRCRCSCDGCPPWDHSSYVCHEKCVQSGVPPISNTGVHGLGNAAACLEKAGSKNSRNTEEKRK